MSSRTSNGQLVLHLKKTRLIYRKVSYTGYLKQFRVYRENTKFLYMEKVKRAFFDILLIFLEKAKKV